jgi:hypothetical protein
MPVRRIVTKTAIASLTWDGDDLLDLVNGPNRWRPDGTEDRPQPTGSFGFPFDQTIMDPGGEYQVIYTERGTKALLMTGGTVHRELNRGYYQSDTFDYPIALGTLPDGRVVVVHCPDEYNVLQIDEADTGRHLTPGPRSPIDIFHSRLSVSADGRHLLTAGWYWHPYGVCMVFDLVEALRDPAALDNRGQESLFLAVRAEVESACWLDDDRIAIATTDEGVPDGADEADRLGPRQIGVWSIRNERFLHRTTVHYPVGTMIACGDLVVTLFGHPRLVEPATGAILAEWPDVNAGVKSGSYGVIHVPTPITALHPDRTRLAIVQPDGIAVLDFTDTDPVSGGGRVPTG